ncbi:hypothetical protein E3T39_01950 [Cryobacterium suzukii]|uniref:Carbohydrate kinase PfkB domain-containing protein n=1 Tax=Cryobacterium suzukii TaxID=1259198 RepID=A0A4R9AIV3_9MICO|nr:PfkB family carbohydrate kinase [Cryobacterium suzukii]TFD62724.1 hypothetical protein E3T39_01950 [Cryobacterium suzukii]
MFGYSCEPSYTACPSWQGQLWARPTNFAGNEKCFCGASAEPDRCLLDIVFAGEDEAGIAVDPADPSDLSRRLTDLGPSQAVIKLGHRGALALINGETLQQDAVPITPVDSVGAGDAFVAGYLAEYIKGSSSAERLALAAKTGAFACLAYGDWEGLPRRRELDLLSATETVIR